MKHVRLFLVSLIFGTGAFAQYPRSRSGSWCLSPRENRWTRRRASSASVVGGSRSADRGGQPRRRGGTIGQRSSGEGTPDGYTLLWGTSGRLRSGRVSTRNSATTSPRISSRCRWSRLCLSCFSRAGAAGELGDRARRLCQGASGRDQLRLDGVGSGLHLIAELFKSVAGIQIVHVPYKGVAQALPEMMSARCRSHSIRFRPSCRT